MLKHATALILWLAASPAAAVAQPAPPDEIRASAETWLAREGVGSLSVGVVRGDAEICLAIGEASAGRPADPRTRYEIGSITKTFTGLLLARAAVDGRVALDDPVASRLAGDYPGLAFADRPVRLVHLASMTSGLPDDLPPRPPADPAISAHDRVFARARQIEAYSDDAFLTDLSGVVLSQEPGVSPGHSNTAAQLLGLILEGTYATSYADLVDRFIETPAGMAHRPDAAIADSRDLAGEPMPYLTAASARASGGLTYGAADMVRYARLHLDESDPAVRLSHQPVWKTLDGELGIALGWIWHADSPAGRRLRASGGSFGFAAFLDVYPDTGVAVTLLTNGADDPTQEQLQALSEQIVALVIQDGGLAADPAYACD